MAKDFFTAWKNSTENVFLTASPRVAPVKLQKRHRAQQIRRLVSEGTRGVLASGSSEEGGFSMSMSRPHVRHDGEKSWARGCCQYVLRTTVYFNPSIRSTDLALT